jgi:hypothetical protein
MRMSRRFVYKPVLIEPQSAGGVAQVPGSTLARPRGGLAASAARWKPRRFAPDEESHIMLRRVFCALLLTALAHADPKIYVGGSAKAEIDGNKLYIDGSKQAELSGDKIYRGGSKVGEFSGKYVYKDGKKIAELSGKHLYIDGHKAWEFSGDSAYFEGSKRLEVKNLAQDEHALRMTLIYILFF